MKKLSLIIGTWFGTGLLPPPLKKINGMAGTYGSIFAIPLCILLIHLSQILKSPHTIYILLSFIIGSFGMTIISHAEKELGPRKDWRGKIKDRDQNQIVIDEVFGMLITCFPITFLSEYSWIHFLGGLILFRIFDITKIPPTRFFDQMKNPFGVMMDDFIAGIYGAISLQILISIF